MTASPAIAARARGRGRAAAQRVLDARSGLALVEATLALMRLGDALLDAYDAAQAAARACSTTTI